MKNLKISVNCGKKWCNPKLGKKCQFLQKCSSRSSAHCILFNFCLTCPEACESGLIGRVLRCDECLEAEFQTLKAELV